MRYSLKMLNEKIQIQVEKWDIVLLTFLINFHKQFSQFYGCFDSLHRLYMVKEEEQLFDQERF